MTVTLYSLEGCPYCELVVDKLDELGVPFAEIRVEGLHSKRDRVKSVTGQRQVPALVDDEYGVKMSQSSRIVEYLETTYSGWKRRTAGNRPLPTSLGLTTSLVEGSVGPRSHGPCERACGPCAEGALMWASPAVVAGEEGRSSPVPNDRRGRRPHHSGAGLLRPVIPATCATVSLVICRAAPGKSVSDSESAGRSHSSCFPACRLLLTGRARRFAPRIRGGEAASQTRSDGRRDLRSRTT